MLMQARCTGLRSSGVARQCAVVPARVAMVASGRLAPILGTACYEGRQAARPVLFALHRIACRAAVDAERPTSSGDLAGIPSTADGKLISRTEVAAFIQRDDMMDQMFQWAVIEAGEGGVRNFGLPMTVEPFYKPFPDGSMLWGYRVGIYKEGVHLCDLGIMFDEVEVNKHEWVGRDDDGFPVLEGKVDAVQGKHLEIWKLDAKPVDEVLRASIRSFCTGLVTALNRYYAFGSVFVDDAQ